MRASVYVPGTKLPYVLMFFSSTLHDFSLNKYGLKSPYLTLVDTYKPFFSTCTVTMPVTFYALILMSIYISSFQVSVSESFRNNKM